jgi:lysozyme family protein
MTEQEPTYAAGAASADGRFDRCLEEVLRLEGGYVDDPRDPGGATRFGVTRAVLSEALGRAASADDVAAMTEAQAGEIYRRRYWAAASCADLPAGLDLLAFDMAVNMGPGTAARLLQVALGAPVDGVIGPRTLAEAQAAPAAATIRAVSDLRRRRYRSLAGFAAFGRGWLSRTDAVEALALQWAQQPDGDDISGDTHVA